MSIVPWKQGRALVWDSTCPDTLAPSYEHLATREAGAVATEMAPRKNMKYAHLNAIHLFVPIANETFGMMGPEARLFCQELGRASPQPHWIPSPTNTCHSAYQLLFSMAMLLLSWAHCRRAPLGLRSRA